MKALVVYDSVYGNTEKVAQAVSSALGVESGSPVQALKVGSVNPEQLVGLDLLIVGSPTRAFAMTPATKKFLKSIPSGALKGVRVAAFDTRASLEEVNNAFLTFMVGIFGYAAQPIEKRLRRKGGKVASPAEGFLVTGTEGPLKEGELDRAAEWAVRVKAS